MSRDDFSPTIKQTAATRAGYRCSNPACRAQTAGPQVTPDKGLNIGVAAHITAAAPGGPRYDPCLSNVQRADINNAIWLCQTCAKLVDNDPQLFTTSMLMDWRRKAEAFAFVEIGKAQIDLRAGSRRAELAEQMLADFHRAVDIIKAARSPLRFAGEGETRPKAPGESPGRSTRLNGYYTVTERLSKWNEFFSELFSVQRYRVVAVFGKDAARPFDELLWVINDVHIVVGILLDLDGPDGYLPTNQRRDFEARIGWGDPNRDPISPRLDAILKRAEEIFRPSIGVWA
jgi:hypothetical protein